MKYNTINKEFLWWTQEQTGYNWEKQSELKYMLTEIIYMRHKKSDSAVAHLCPVLCDPIDHSLPGSSINGIFQARILEWVAIAFSRRSSQPRDWTRVSRVVGRCFTIWATRIAVKFGGGEFTRMNPDIGILSLCWFILGIWGSLGVRSACLMTSLCSLWFLGP